MRIGLIARADSTGLAAQTYEFWRHMKPAKTLVIRPDWNSRLVFQPSLYPDGIAHSTQYPHTLAQPDPVLDQFLQGLDVVFTCETPYNYWLYERARELGVKTVQQFNFEFLDYHKFTLPLPDLFAAPSLWRFSEVPFRNKVYLPVPVNREVLPFRQRRSLRTLLHVAGIYAAHDRNGTQSVIEAMRLLPAGLDLRLRLRTQYPIDNPCPDRIEVVHGVTDHYWQNYGDEDVMIFPRKFGGLCLPFHEAMSCGMPVITTAIEPQIRFMSCRALVPASKVMEFEAHATIELYEADPRVLADRILELHRHPELVASLSTHASEYAETISWGRLEPLYRRTFERLVAGKLSYVA